MKMTGLVLTREGKLEWQEFPVPKVNPFGALIKVEAVSPCTTDIHGIQSNFAICPWIIGRPFGHECVGTICEVGEQVKDFKPGDRVAVSAAIPNPRSMEGLAGEPRCCDTSYFTIDHPDRAGCFVDYYYILDADMTLAHIPDNVTMEQALMADDMIATCYAGVEEMEVKFGDTVVVLGIGPVGLCGVRLSVLKGAGRVFAVGSRQCCFDVAKEFGASDVVDYHNEDYVEQILAANGGPVDRVLLAGGTFDSITDALRMLKQGGVLSNVCNFGHEKDASMPGWAWGRGRTMKSVRAQGGRYHMEKIMKLIQYGRIQPERIISHSFHGKDKLIEAIELFLKHDRSLIKPVVYFD